MTAMTQENRTDDMRLWALGVALVGMVAAVTAALWPAPSWPVASIGILGAVVAWVGAANLIPDAESGDR